MFRKLMLLLVVLSLLLSACGGAAPATTAPAEPTQGATTGGGEEVTIRWRTRPDNQEEQNVYQAISDEIDAKLANVKLVYDPAPVQGYMDKLVTELSAGTAPDRHRDSRSWLAGRSTRNEMAVPPTETGGRTACRRT